MKARQKNYLNQIFEDSTINECYFFLYFLENLTICKPLPPTKANLKLNARQIGLIHIKAIIGLKKAQKAAIISEIIRIKFVHIQEFEECEISKSEQKELFREIYKFLLICL